MPFLFLFLFVPMAFAHPVLDVGPLRPGKTTDLKIGRLTATLVDVSRGHTVKKVVGDLGDCRTCIRGASLRGEIGIRLMGSDLENLKVARKNASSSVQIVSCAQGAAVKNGSFHCDFLQNGRLYKFSFRVER